MFLIDHHDNRRHQHLNHRRHIRWIIPQHRNTHSHKHTLRERERERQIDKQTDTAVNKWTLKFFIDLSIEINDPSVISCGWSSWTLQPQLFATISVVLYLDLSVACMHACMRVFNRLGQLLIDVIKRNCLCASTSFMTTAKLAWVTYLSVRSALTQQTMCWWCVDTSSSSVPPSVVFPQLLFMDQHHAVRLYIYIYICVCVCVCGLYSAHIAPQSSHSAVCQKHNAYMARLPHSILTSLHLR